MDSNCMASATDAAFGPIEDEMSQLSVVEESPEAEHVHEINGDWVGSEIAPFNERAPRRRRRVAFIWSCCECICAGMAINVGKCIACGLPRCALCLVEKVAVRG
ncbi:hypothetical protein EDB81DRAFT_377349 [Dactylonectria macrodidyma]|uniref:Uncharacterized protein n=1 Tax=Dactylonectria macrodidyma TaxID=307937 RepID=A0A9P9F9W5_9HYPO|nr:hypothetical protein EDB81DRAFT_377349 [Dactylonectria macrodidyma]